MHVGKGSGYITHCVEQYEEEEDEEERSCLDTVQAKLRNLYNYDKLLKRSLRVTPDTYPIHSQH